MTKENENCWLYNKCNHIDCDHFCMKRFKLDKLYNEALISDMQREYIPLRVDSNNNDKEAFLRLSNIENNIEEFIWGGNNLYIHSSTCGNGKTSWALRLVQAYLNKIWVKSSITCRVLFISVPRFLIAIKDNITTKSDYVEHIKDNVLNCDLVVWDDIGTKSATQFEHENLLSMIDSRISLGKSNIFTSNINTEDVPNVLGNRLASRIVNASVDIELVGADKRSLGGI